MADFQGSATSTPFAPVRAVDQTPAMRDQLQQKLGWMREDNQANITNRNEVGAATAESNRSKQRQTSGNLEELASFSKSVSELMLNRQKQVNENDLNEGMYQYWIGNGDPKAIEAFRTGEAQLNEADKIVNGVALKAARDGEAPPVVSAIRNLSGKKKVGYLTALAQDKGRGYGSWLEDKLANDDKTQIKLGDITVTPKDAAKDQAILSGVTASLRMQFIRENGLDQANPALLNEHLFPSMRDGEARVVGKASKAIIIGKATQEVDEAAGVFVNSIKNGTPDFNGIVSRLASVVNPKTGERFDIAGARDYALELLTQVGSEGEEGKLTESMIQQIEDTPDLEGKQSWGKRFPQLFIGLRDKLKAANRSDSNAREAEQADQAKLFANDAYQLSLQKGGFNEAEIAQLRSTWSEKFDVPFPEKLSSLQSTEKLSEAESEKYIQRKIRNGEPLTDKDMVGLNFNAWQRYSTQIKRNKENVTGSDDAKAHIKSLEQALALNIKVTSTSSIPNPTLVLAQNRAKRDYISRMNNLIESGVTPALAQTQAYESVLKEIAAGNLQPGGPDKANKAGSGIYALTPDNQTGYKNFLPGGASKADALHAQMQLQEVNAKMLAVKGPPKQAIAKAVLISAHDFAAIEELRTDPSGAVPASILWLAKKTGMSEWDVMDYQLKVAKKPLLTKPPAVQYGDTLDPRFQQLLKSFPSQRRTNRAFAGQPWSPAKVPNGWGSLIEKSAAANGLDPALLAGLLGHESSWIPNNRSRAGAAGLAQLMPDTARELGVRNPDNPAEAIPAAAKYLAQQIKAFGGDIRLGLRAYNSGEGNTSRFPNGVTTEARNYPDKVLAAAGIYGYGQTGGSPYAQPGMISPHLVYKIHSLGYGSTGPHLDVKPVARGTTKSDRSQSIKPTDLDNFVSVKSGGKLRPLSQGTTTSNTDAQHRDRGSFGNDFAAPDGTELYLRNGARVVGTFKGEGGTDHTIVELPDGRRFQFLHGLNA